MTYIRLPSHFLSPFSLLNDPRTGNPWLNPDEINVDFLGKHETSDSSDRLVDSVPNAFPENSDLLLKEQRGTELLAASSLQGLDTVLTVPQPPSSFSPCPLPVTQFSLELLSSPLVLDAISSLERRQIYRFIPLLWKERIDIHRRGIVWRKDMSEYVLQRMRDAATRGLQYLSSRPGKMYLAPISEGWSGVNRVTQVGALLWTGVGEAGTFALSGPEGSVALEKPKSKPPPYAMFDWRKHRIPIYNLPDLLGEGNARQLAELAPIFKSELIAIKRKSNTAGLQMLFWKLMGYLATKDKGTSTDE